MAPIIRPERFDAVEQRRRMRAPDVTPPRIVSSPTLLTGLLKCAECGAGMTLATGKGGRYRWYKRNTRIGQSIHACTTPAVPMGKLDAAVLGALADKVLTVDRLKEMVPEPRSRMKTVQASQDEAVQTLQRELAELELGTSRLYEAVEKGILPMDSKLSDRAQKLKARRESILVEIAGARPAKEMPLASITGAQIAAFSEALRARLLEGGGGFAKWYLRPFVDEVRFDGERLKMRGGKAARLAAVAHREMSTARVPTSGPGWLGDPIDNIDPAPVVGPRSRVLRLASMPGPDPRFGRSMGWTRGLRPFRPAMISGSESSALEPRSALTLHA